MISSVHSALVAWSIGPAPENTQTHTHTQKVQQRNASQTMREVCSYSPTSLSMAASLSFSFFASFRFSSRSLPAGRFGMVSLIARLLLLHDDTLRQQQGISDRATLQQALQSASCDRGASSLLRFWLFDRWLETCREFQVLQVHPSRLRLGSQPHRLLDGALLLMLRTLFL